MLNWRDKPIRIIGDLDNQLRKVDFYCNQVWIAMEAQCFSRGNNWSFNYYLEYFRHLFVCSIRTLPTKFRNTYCNTTVFTPIPSEWSLPFWCTERNVCCVTTNQLLFLSGDGGTKINEVGALVKWYWQERKNHGARRNICHITLCPT
jgi:hypothetical protein